MLASSAAGASTYGLMLGDVMTAYGFGPPSEYGRNAVFRSRASTLVIESGSRKIVFDGFPIYLNSAIMRAGQDWVIAPIDAVDTLGAMLFPGHALKSAGWTTVVLDAGHGGDDPGAQYGRLPEKRLTLDIAKRVKVKLLSCRVDCRMLRDRDVTMSLDERCSRAARLGADLLVSIHLNASPNRTMSGVETYVVPAAGYAATAESERPRSGRRYLACPGNRFDGANLLLAQCVQKGVVTQSRAEDRGTRRARYYVLRNASCPATLVECGFLSNPRESARILDEGYQDSVAEGIARGILTYISKARELHLPPVYRQQPAAVGAEAR